MGMNLQLLLLMFDNKMKILLLVALVGVAHAVPTYNRENSDDDDRYMHSSHHHHITRRATRGKAGEEDTATFWNQQAQLALDAKLKAELNTGVAKNVIMFLGDGMSIPTLTSARIYMGNLQNITGENLQLSFEKFRHIGLSKTYCVDKQVADSACSATAYLCGVKGNSGTIGVTGQVPFTNCSASVDVNTHVDSIARWSQLKNKRTGVVTTTRVTHASPAGTYAKTAHRDWESDADLAGDNVNFDECPDIAYQLIHGETGKNFNVILGGGYRYFIPTTKSSPSYKKGKRLDGRDLIEEWKNMTQGQFVQNKAELLSVPENTEYMMGLFQDSHLDYYLDADPTQPTLADLTEAAIKVLSKGENGYFLFVEGGRIDHAHHDTKAHKALAETLQLSEAVQKAVDLTNEADTLIVVTSDHAHVMSLSGYADRSNPILGIAGTGSDNIPYTTLSYANGPGYREACDRRYDPSVDDTTDKEYEFPAMVPLSSETHGGDDVAIFARGPWSHLFTGVNEQNTIPHMMAYASCVGKGVTVCDAQ